MNKTMTVCVNDKRNVAPDHTDQKRTTEQLEVKSVTIETRNAMMSFSDQTLPESELLTWKTELKK